jgi:hypothetical protein
MNENKYHYLFTEGDKGNNIRFGVMNTNDFFYVKNGLYILFKMFQSILFYWRWENFLGVDIANKSQNIWATIFLYRRRWLPKLQVNMQPVKDTPLSLKYALELPLCSYQQKWAKYACKCARVSKGPSFTSNRQRRKEGTFCASELAGIGGRGGGGGGVLHFQSWLFLGIA